jgi:hypothetical protein
VHDPAVQADDGNAGPPGQRHLGERSPRAADRDDDRRRAHDQQVAALTETGGDRDIDPVVGRRRVVARQQPDHAPAGLARAARGGGHHAAEPAGDQRRAGAGEARTDGLGRGEQRRVGHVPGTHDGDLRPTAYGSHCWRKQMSTSHFTKPSHS